MNKLLEIVYSPQHKEQSNLTSPQHSRGMSTRTECGRGSQSRSQSISRSSSQTSKGARILATPPHHRCFVSSTDQGLVGWLVG